jgi:hypothetical protein
MIRSLREIAAAVAACRAGYQAAPMRAIGERDRAIEFSRSEGGATLQEAVSVCSFLTDSTPEEADPAQQHHHAGLRCEARRDTRPGSRQVANATRRCRTVSLSDSR